MGYCIATDGTKLNDEYVKELVYTAEFEVAHFIVCKYITKRNLSGLHLRIINHRGDRKKTLHLAPRGHGKSTIGDVDYCITKLLRDANLRIMIGSKTQGQAEAFLKEIRTHFEANEDLIRVFGNLRGDKWNDKEMTLSSRTLIKKEASLTALGASGAVVSKHFDLIICDDLVGFENARTGTQRAKLKEWFYSSLEPTLEPTGEIRVLGTRYHPNDLYQDFIETGDYDVVVQKALNIYNEEEFGTWKERGLLPADIKEGDEFPLWDYFGLEDLQKRKAASGSIIFGMQYQNTTDLAKGNIFKNEYLRYYDSYSIRQDGKVVVTLKDENTGEQINKICRVYMGVDLAISQNTSADYFVIAVVGRDDDNNYYVLDYFMDRLSFDNQLNKILEYGHIKFSGVERIGVEAVAYQQAMCQQLRRESNLPIIDVKTNTDKITRMMRLSAKFECGKVFIRPNMHYLIDELLLYPETPDGHDDLSDAIDFAISMGEEKNKIKVLKSNLYI